MRLLNTLTFELDNFVGQLPEYVILSHRWESEELTFEINSKDPISNPNSSSRAKTGFAKVEGICKLALNDGFKWIWIDSLNIDKSSSAELQESINSMFKWYAKAQLCYVYLNDVADEAAGWSSPFEKSQWFTRVWTLQELLAPWAVEFYAADWSAIGSKMNRHEQIAKITGIADEVITRPWSEIGSVIVAAEKLSWAACRQATRSEDESYSLLGLFDVNISMLYGEGRTNAFHRLQQAIYERDADHSLFLFEWRGNPKYDCLPLLADDSSAFCQRARCAKCSRVKHSQEIKYSSLSRIDVPTDATNDEHLIRIVRDGIIVNLPVTELAGLPQSQLRAEDFTTLSISGLMGATLNVSYKDRGQVILALERERSRKGAFSRLDIGIIYLEGSRQRTGTAKVPQSTFMVVPHLSPVIYRPYNYSTLVEIGKNLPNLGVDWKVELATGVSGHFTPCGHLAIRCMKERELSFVRVDIGEDSLVLARLWAICCVIDHNGDRRLTLQRIGVYSTALYSFGGISDVQATAHGDQARVELSDGTSIHVRLRILVPSEEYEAHYRIDVRIERSH